MILPVLACNDALGMESGVILDKYISVSSTSSISGPDRARLNTTQLDGVYQALLIQKIKTLFSPTLWKYKVLKVVCKYKLIL